MKNLKFLFFGIYFGIVLIKSEIASWFRIQEMFRFQSIFMYGILGIAVMVGAVSILVIKRLKLKSVNQEPINLKGKPFTKGNIIGGFLFGCGWALTGACPGPLYALVGDGYLVIIPVLLSAILGAYVYGLLQKRLPH
jgi:uncharacterized membrane protein YedE/YeeE